MKQGRTLMELAAEITRQAEAKADYLAPTTALEVGVDGGRPVVMLGSHEVEVPELGITSLAHGQIAEHVAIPKRYYDRMLTEQPQLWAQSVNTWLHAKPETRLVRTLDGNVRAFLSRSYRRLDNSALAEAVLPVLRETDGVSLASCELTERRMFIKAIRASITGEVRPGDIVQLGVQISNSEVGEGGVSVSPIVLRCICMNGATVNEFSARSIHLGRSQDTDSVRQLMSDEALRAEDRALFLKLRDVLRQTLSGSVWAQMLAAMQKAAAQPITGNPVAVVEKLAADRQLTEGVQTSILQQLINGGDLTRWGLINAVTAAAKEPEDYDVATELETLGGAILTLKPSEWDLLAKAA